MISKKLKKIIAKGKVSEIKFFLNTNRGIAKVDKISIDSNNVFFRATASEKVKILGIILVYKKDVVGFLENPVTLEKGDSHIFTMVFKK